MGFDIRLPIGLLFTTLGALLILFGLATLLADLAALAGYEYQPELGIILLIFGLLVVFFARQSRGCQIRQEAAQQTS